MHNKELQLASISSDPRIKTTKSGIRANCREKNSHVVKNSSLLADGVITLNNINNDLDKAQVCLKVVETKAKMKFLSICVNRTILLPSNDKKDINHHLFLLQQERRIQKQLKVVNTYLKNFDNKTFSSWKKFQKRTVLTYKYKRINKYKHKASRLWKKQIERRRCLPPILKHQAKLKQRNRRRKQRYRERKKKASKQELIDRVNSIVLDKTDLDLDFEIKLLLSRGLNFAPTLKWTDTTDDLDWESLQKHGKRAKWANLFKDTDRNFETFLLKLKVPNFFDLPKIN